MDKITPQAFADSVIAFAKKQLSQHEAKFLNSFFHKIIADKENLLANTADDLNLGQELENQWAKEFSKEQIAEFAKTLSKEAPLSCRFLRKTEHHLKPVSISTWKSKFDFFEIENAQNSSQTSNKMIFIFKTPPPV